MLLEDFPHLHLCCAYLHCTDALASPVNRKMQVKHEFGYHWILGAPSLSLKTSIAMRTARSQIRNNLHSVTLFLQLDDLALLVVSCLHVAMSATASARPDMVSQYNGIIFGRDEFVVHCFFSSRLS